MSWEPTQLGEMITVKHGYAFKSQFFADEGKYVLLSPGNFYEEGGLKLKGDKEKYYTGDFPNEYLLKAGDLIMVMTDLVNTAPILGGSAIIPEDDRFLHNQRLGLVEIKSREKIDKGFLYHLLNTREYRGQIRGSASGATVKHTAPERIYRCTLRIPKELKTQRRIASILTEYDDLIETNLRRIRLLEKSARLVYQEWFVRLRFPGHEHTPIVKGVPRGWERRELGEICDEVRDAVAPQEMDPETPYIGLEHIPRRSITLSAWGRAQEVTSSKHEFRAGDILFGKIRPYFHKVGIALVNGVASSDAIVLRPKEERLAGLVLSIVSSDRFVAEASQKMKEGSKMPRADWKIMQEFSVLLPPRAILEAFASYMVTTTLQLKLLAMQNLNLKKARDILLPKLMSGEIKI